MFSGDLLHHLDTNTFLGMDGSHKVTEAAVQDAHQALSIIDQQSWLTGEVPAD